MCHYARYQMYFFENPDQCDSLHKQIADHVSDSRWCQNNQHTVCVDRADYYNDENTSPGSIRIFLQGTGGFPGNEIKTLAERIVEHGSARLRDLRQRACVL